MTTPPLEKQNGHKLTNSDEPQDTYGTKLSPYAKSLMKALGGEPRAMSLEPSQVAKWGTDRPNSVVNLIADEDFKASILALPLELVNAPEDQMLRDSRPTPLDRRMKISFWEEYERAARSLVPMRLDSVALDTGAQSWAVYKTNLYRTPALLAWFSAPPAEYRLEMKEVHQVGIQRLREIFSLPIIDPKTQQVNTKIGALILAAYKMLDARLHGAVTQKIVSLSASAGEAPPDSSMDMMSVDKKLAELEAILTEAKALPPLPEE